MKLIHLSDLHLGKRLNEYSMIEDQEYILKSILQIIDAEAPDGVIIAGDVYDKAVPSAEAVSLFDKFLVALAKRRLEVFVISGNHDSPERIAFGSRIMDAGGIHMSPVYDGGIEPIRLKDRYGEVRVYMLPFVKPAHVRSFFENEKIDTYTDAIRCAVEHMQIDPRERNVLVTHQFVTGASRSESEEISVGGTDNVDASVFDAFDYVALGHIHNPQNIGSERIRYCGTPLKYSASEAGSTKSVTIAELGEKGAEPVITEIPLTPLRDMKKLRGRFEELILGTDENFVHVSLTDETDVPDAMGKLRMRYPFILGMEYARQKEPDMETIEELRQEPDKDPEELFAAFFEQVQGIKMSEQQAQIIHDLVEALWKKEENA